MPARESSAEIDRAATEWAVRGEGVALSDVEQSELDAWLSADARRLGAFVRANALLVHARRARALGADFNSRRFLDEYGGAHASRPLTAPVSRRRALIGGSSAAAVAALAAIGVGWPAAAETFSTRRGEIRLIPLSDGSSMTLNTQSTARVAFTELERRVELVRGEALFDVVMDAATPFLVAAGEIRIRAASTSFTVRRLADEPVEIIVRQGSVEIDRAGPGARSNYVSANSRAVADGQSPVHSVDLSPAEIVRELSWRDGMLSFEDMPLGRAALEFARYSDRPIRFGDPALADETITGLYAANNPAGFARSVALSLGVRAEISDEAIVLR